MKAFTACALIAVLASATDMNYRLPKVRGYGKSHAYDPAPAY